MLGERYEDVQGVNDTELSRNRQKHHIGGFHRSIAPQSLDELVRHSRIGLSEGGSGVVDDPDLITLSPTAPAEVQVIDVAGDREDAATDGHSRGPVVTGGPPRSAVAFDLLSLQIGESRACGF